MIKSLPFFLFILVHISIASSQIQVNRTVGLMGSRFDITVVDQDSIKAEQYVDIAIEEISRIERLISSWDPNSQTSAINKNAGIRPVVVDDELFQLIKRAIVISKLTDGAFDITYASMDNIWKFDGSMKEMPSKESMEQSVRLIGYQHIVLNEEERSVFLEKKGMKIGFGAIGKGYAADKTKQLLISKGVSSGIINASGDLTTWGNQPSGEAWKVAITNPMNKEVAFGTFPIVNSSVVTSGDYEKYVLFNDIRYSHIINPKTGLPATGIISATVFAPSAELADALATASFVMGIDTAIDRINQISNVDCLLVDDQGNLHQSNNIKINEN